MRIAPVMPAIRVALINVPALMRDIVELEFSHQPDFEVVPIAPSIATRPGPLSPALDAIIVGAEGGGTLPNPSAMLEMWPRAKVLLISSGGRDTTLFTLRQQRIELGHLDAQELVGAIRTALENYSTGEA